MTTKVKRGDVTVEVANHLAPPADAGKLTPKELLRLPSVRTGVGVLCEDVIEALRRTSGSFTAPRGVTPEALRKLGQRAEGYDQVLAGIDAVREIFSQANRIADAEAHTALSRLYDQVKAQAKDDPTLKTEFSAMFAYFSTAGGKKRKGTQE